MFRSLTLVPVLGSFTKRLYIWLNKTTLLWSVGWHKANAVWQLAREGHCAICAMQVLLGGALCDSTMNSTALECREASIKGPATSFMTTSAQEPNLWTPSCEQMSASWSSGHTIGLKNAETQSADMQRKHQLLSPMHCECQSCRSTEVPFFGISPWRCAACPASLWDSPQCCTSQPGSMLGSAKTCNNHKRFTVASSSSLTSDMAFSVWTTARCRSSDTSRTVCLSQSPNTRWCSVLEWNKWRSPVTLHRT